MEGDTGAAIALMSETTHKKLFPEVKLKNSTVDLQTYTQESVSALGAMEVEVRYGSYLGTHILYVVKGSGPSLFGHNWLTDIRLDWQT